MGIELNHTIVHSRDKTAAAEFLTDLFDLDPPTPYGPFLVVELANGVSLDFIDHGEGEIGLEHYAFLVSEDDFTRIYGTIVQREIDHWADPHRSLARQINHHDGGRGVYFPDPTGHLLEIITRPYGSGS